MNSRDQDTIAAIATPPGEAGIAIVRVSGSESLTIADRIFRHPRLKPSDMRGGRFAYGHVHDSDGKRIDEVILLVYREGRSYTREDVVEFQCHGGRISARRILQAVLQAGARHATPGEFTQRAFLNGRLDLVQAEAVIDLIRARSDRAAILASEQLQGNLSICITSIYNTIVALAADMEATLDFEEDELPETVLNGVIGRLRDIEKQLQALLATWNEGRLLREGAMVVIAGPPNAGKSTLLNCLLGTARAIVTEVPGTTRDVIEEQIVLDGIPIRLVDTAGLRWTENLVEQAGIERARNAIERADLVLFVIDGSVPMTTEDGQTLAAITKPCIVVANKSDLGKSFAQDSFCHPVIVTSLLRGSGLDLLKKQIARQLEADIGTTNHVAISERHRENLSEAEEAIHHAVQIIGQEKSDMYVIAAQHVRFASGAVAKILGRDCNNDVIDMIFSKFCIGK